MNVTALKPSLKLLSVVFLLLAVGALTPASASIVYQTTVNLGGAPGHILEVLAIQNAGSESGCVRWNGSADAYTSCEAGVFPIAGGDQKNEGSKTLTRTIGGVTNLATNGAADLAIVFVGNEGSSPSVVIQELVVTFYNPAGTLLYKAWLPSPHSIADVGSGGGWAGFIYRLDYEQAAQAQLLAFSGGSFQNNRIGLAAAVNNTGSGAEVFYVGTGSAFGLDPIPVPEPVSSLTVGAGLLGIALLLRRRRNRRT